MKDYDKELMEDMASFAHNPLGFVLYSFPWDSGVLIGKHGPRKWQRTFLLRLGEELKKGKMNAHQAIQMAVASGHGPGKAEAITNIIPTPNGLVKFGNLKPGDYVFGSSGQKTKVTATKSWGKRPCYKVTFDDSSFVIVDENHDWSVRGRQERRKNLDTWRVLSTKQILEFGVKRPNGKAQARQWEIPSCKPVCGYIKEPHAYAIGIWLGDGARRRSGYSKPYLEARDHIIATGLTVKTSQTGHGQYIHGFKSKLESLGLFDLYSYERFIPEVCFQWRSEDRAELLRGLLDSDGECAKDGCIIFSSSSSKLLEGVKRLTRSLGGKSNTTTVKEAYIGEVRHRDCYRTVLSLPNGFNPFYIKHKAERVKLEIEQRYFTRWIDSIERVKDQETMCIEVEAKDGLYLTTDYIVTHNSTLVAQLILWALSTFPDTRVIVTANTEGQLRNKTWPECIKWHQLFIAKHWFEATATAMYVKDPKHSKTWRADAIPWSESSTESFAGLHNSGKRILLIFDEASAISDKIYTVSEGALTDANTEIIWLLFGNPTRNTGRFRETFGRLRHRWITYQIDTREVEGVNQDQIKAWQQDYGEDSDFFKVRVRGMFPSSSSLQFIPSDVVREAMEREARSFIDDPLIMGVDIARSGDDSSVIRFRRGFDARSIPPIRLKLKDTMQLVSATIEAINNNRPDAIFIDATGLGGPFGDRLRQLGYNAIDVNFASKSPNDKYANMRAYMWGKGKEWLIAGGAIDADSLLEQDLIGPEYGHNMRDQLQLEKKDHMKARGLASPDDGDALMLTFAQPVALQGEYSPSNVTRSSDGYDPFKD